MEIPPEHGVLITMKDIYTLTIGMSAKVDQLLAEHMDTERRLNDHETRMRALERGRWPLPAVSVLLALASLAVAIIVTVQ